MNKRIQLRGISHIPSDRMTKMGGCSESINVALENEEIVPASAPVNITAEFGGETFTNVPIYVHELRGIKNLILVGSEDPNSTIYFTNVNTEEEIKVGSFPEEQITGVTSFGNLICIYTETKAYYARWNADDSDYDWLGELFQEPELDFLCTAVPLNMAQAEKTALSISSGGTDDDIIKLDEAAWNSFINETADASGEKYNEHKELVNKIISRSWDAIVQMIDANRILGYHCAPRLARYAVKLYDGTYIYQSAPVLLGPFGAAHSDSNNELAKINCYYYAGGLRDEVITYLHSPKIFTAKASVSSSWASGLGTWKELIQSVDVFVSPAINYPAIRAKASSFTSEDAVGSDNLVRIGHIYLADYDEENAKEELLKASNFYKVASVPIEDISELESGLTIEPISEDDLLVRETLEDDQYSLHRYTITSALYQYNKRLFASHMGRFLYPGYPYFQAKIKNATLTPYIEGGANYKIIFFVKDESGKTHKVCRALQDDPGTSSITAVSWITYPDTRCYKAILTWVVEDTGYAVKEFVMKEHPRLNCAYAFGGFGDNILSGYTLSGTDPSSGIDNEDAFLSTDDTIYMSKTDNPFIFPLANRTQMSSYVIGIAAATKALSQGQFGQYPLYAFTEDGIWALPISDTGLIAASKPMSREVAIEGTIVPIDDAIVFTTDRGVLLLRGSDITNISSSILGPAEIADESLTAILDATDWDVAFGEIITDTERFLDKMKHSKPVYDYAGERLIFFDQLGAEYFQYVYKINTDTWHKIAVPVNFVGRTMEATVLNSYPQAIVAALGEYESGSDAFIVLDYSSFTENNDARYGTGMIITRAFDLDEPDVRKSISQLMIRGTHKKETDKNHVQYVLLGSMDGVHFGVVPSLRGTSFKQYKLALLLDLDEDERISWIDIDYDSRFTNKLR